MVRYVASLFGTVHLHRLHSGGQTILAAAAAAEHLTLLKCAEVPHLQGSQRREALPAGRVTSRV